MSFFPPLTLPACIPPQLCPWQARSHQVQGQVHEAAGRATAAMEGYNTALALEPCHAPTLISLGG